MKAEDTSALKEENSSLFERQIKQVNLNSSETSNDSPDDTSNKNSPGDLNVEQAEPKNRKHSLDSNNKTNKKSEVKFRKSSVDSLIKDNSASLDDEKQKIESKKSLRDSSSAKQPRKSSWSPSVFNEEDEESETSTDESDKFKILKVVSLNENGKERRVSFSIDLNEQDDEKEVNNNLKNFIINKLKLSAKNLPASKFANKIEDNRDSSDSNYEQKHSKTPAPSRYASEASEAESRPAIKRQNKAINKTAKKQDSEEQNFSVSKSFDGVDTLYIIHNSGNKETIEFYYKQYNDGSVEYKVHTAGNAEVNHD